MLQIEGIDVSQHQGDIQWPLVKNSNKKFSGVRIGWGEARNASGGELDAKALVNLDACVANGIPPMPYMYSYAQTVEEAKMEANFVKTILTKYPRSTFAYPIAYDVEDQQYQGNIDINPIIDAFCEEIHDSGYKVIVYTSLDWFENKVNDINKGKWFTWLAQWDVDQPEFMPSIWQYSDKGSVEGISGNVDLNICYQDYVNIDNPFPTKAVEVVVTQPSSQSQEVISPADPLSIQVFSVVEEQRVLRLLNYGDIEADGQVGDLTRSARNNARRGYGLAETGESGLDLERCLRGQLMSVQARLNELGYECDIDGRLGDAGTQTTDRVLSFQRDRNLTIDGIIGTNTFTALFSVTNAPVAATAPVVALPEGMASKNFSWYEFACGCIKGDPTSGCNGYPETNYGQIIALQLIDKLQQLRDYVGAIVITCGIRCPENNKFWNGVWDSLHMLGEAIDCYCPGLDIIEFARIAWQVFGIAVRVYPSQEFAHLELSDLGGVYNQEAGEFIY